MNCIQSTRCQTLVACIAALLFFGLCLPSPAGADGRILRSADLYYRQKSYAAALKEYRAALQAGQVPDMRSNEVRYRVAVALGKSLQWDRALAASLEFAQSHRGTIWEARGLYWLGRLYLSVPESGYRVGSAVFRGDNVPKLAPPANDKPRRVSFEQQDRRDVREALEAARILYSRFHSAATLKEEVQLDFDLAHVLYSDARFSAWQADKKWPAPTDSALNINPAGPYSTGLAPPTKVLYLYAHIRFLLHGHAHSSALSLLDEALWLRHYQAAMRNQYAIRYAQDKPVPIPFPYEKRDALALLRQIVREFPDDPIGDQTQFLLGSLLEQDGKFTAAAAEYRRLVAVHPKSKWASDSRYALANLAHRTLSFTAPPIFFPGKTSTVQLSTRNIGAVRFQLYPVKLERWIGQARKRNDPQFSMTDTASMLGGLKRLSRKLGKPVVEWTVPVIDRRDFQPRNKVVTLPLHQSGAFLLVASAPGVSVANLVTRTDLVLVQKVERDHALFFAADARTGRPVPGTEILARETFNEPNEKGQWVNKVASIRAVTGSDGTASLPILRRPNRNGFQVAALAWRGSSYALTQQTGCGDFNDNQGRFKTYGTTDRAVYRPLQTVQFRQVIMERHIGGMKPLVGKPIHVEVFDAKSRRIYAALLNSSEYGSVSGHFALPTDAPLGEYSVRCSVFKVENSGTDNGGSQFRVEEYKKPEFQVTVAPDAERVRLGQPTSARVIAKYYFGGPAANAKVAYRVYRNTYSQTYKFPRPFDFLYDNAGQGSYDMGFRNGEVVAQGTARTDEKGEAKITFPTEADGARWRDQDLSYTVEADVKDSSRRTITGMGTVKATRHDVAVFLNYPHGYAHSEDRVPVEIVTLNPSDLPVSVEGVAKVYRQSADPKGKERLVSEKPLLTDAHGRAILDWSPTRAGYYRVAFSTRDTAGLEVEGSTTIWIAGPELSRGEFLSQGMFLAVENPYYQEGQTAKLLIATEAPDCTVLLTREVNNQILGKRLVHIAGRSAEVSIPLLHRDVPNVYISVVMVRNGQLFQATQELFVPPVRQLAKLSVQADREKYQPGDKAKLSLLATDWQGRPLRTELAVSISDAALNYIQKDYAPDIRVYYYGDRRSESIGSGGSTGTEFQEVDEDTQRAVAYQTHQWVFPDGTGLIDSERQSDAPVDRNVVLKNRRVELFYDGTLNNDPSHAVRRSVWPLGARMALGRSLHWQGQVDKYDRNGVADEAPALAPMSGRSPTEFHSYAKVPAAAKPEAQQQEPAIRRQFLDTAFWTPAVVTDAQGKASVEVTWPDNLTQWRAYTVGNSATAQVGTAETSVTTQKDLLVRLEAPRYFVERDTMLVSAIVQNSTTADAHVKVRLDLTGDTLQLLPDESQSKIETPMGQPKSQIPDVWVDVPKDGEKRVDWNVQVRHEGVVSLRATAQAHSASDATEMSFPVLIHGVERALATSGVLRGGDGRVTVPVSLPQARKPGSSELVVQVNPSLAAVMLDALSYLNDYPYGCIEQTMSRFLPSVLTARVLKEQGYRLEDLRKRMEALAEQAKAGRGALQVDSSPYTYPNGKPGTDSAATARWQNAVFDSRILGRMVSAGMARIREYQHADGGWGWWKDDASDTWMTAYVLFGLIQAREAGSPFDPDRMQRAEQFLLKRFREDDDLHRMAFAARVLALEPAHRSAIRSTVAGRLYTEREKLSAYSKALLSLALSALGEKNKATVLLGNLENSVQLDEQEGTAHWGDSGSDWWRWYNDQVETNAAVLQAYLAVQPGSRIAPMLVKWLVNHREGDNWSSTRETALAVYALSDYIRVNKELAPNYTLTLDLAGRVKRTYKVSRENALLFDNRFVVPDAMLETGTQPLTIAKQGTGTCYYNVFTRCFSQEESIPASGNGIYVTRRYFRLLPGTASGAPEQPPIDIDRPNPFLAGQYELLAEMGTDAETDDTDSGPRYERTALKEGETVTSGDLIEVELLLEAKNDYNYLAFEDVKPAGCEPLEVRSGEKAGQGVCSNFELRDQKVVFFLSSLTQGTRSLSYRLRAEAPGTFHALPTNGYAMYAPALRTLSAEQTITVKDE